MFVWGGAEDQVKTNPLASHKMTKWIKQRGLREKEGYDLAIFVMMIKGRRIESAGV